MHGYDTVRAAIPGRFRSDLAWTGHSTHDGGAFSQARHWAQLGPLHVEHWSFRDQANDRAVDEFRVECSLPRMLRGENTRAIADPVDLDRALDTASAAAGAFLGGAVDLREAHVRRVDVALDWHLDTEAHVQAALRYLGLVRYASTQRPVRHQDGNLSWTRRRGGFTRRVYGKFRDTCAKGEPNPAAWGQLRAEVQCNGQRAVRRAWPGGLLERTVLVGDLAGADAERLRERVMAKLRRVVQGAIETTPIGLMEAVKRLEAASPRKSTAARLIGYAYLIHRLGWEHLDTMLSRSNVYEVRRQFEKAGVDPLAIQWGEDVLAQLDQDVRDQQAVMGQMTVDQWAEADEVLVDELDADDDPDAPLTVEQEDGRE